MSIVLYKEVRFSFEDKADAEVLYLDHLYSYCSRCCKKYLTSVKCSFDLGVPTQSCAQNCDTKVNIVLVNAHRRLDSQNLLKEQNQWDMQSSEVSLL